MTRVEFMERLKVLLMDAPGSEREEALQYYNDYFDDAGVENEQQVLADLGSPESIAESIKKDSAAQQAAIEANQDTAVIQYREIYSEQEEGTTITSKTEQEKQGVPVWLIILLVILAIFVCPAIFGSAFGALGGLFGLLVGWLCISIVPFIVAVAFGITFFVAIIGAVVSFLVSPYIGLALVGIAFVSLGICLFSLMLGVLMIGKITPAIFRGIKKAVIWVKNKLFAGKEGI